MDVKHIGLRGDKMFNGLYNNIDFYKKALDGTWDRNKAINSNLANINTPNYKRKTVSFEDQLKNSIDKKNIELERTNEKHIKNRSQKFSPSFDIKNSMAARIDGNNVNIDTENAELAKNTIMYNALVQQISGEFQKIKNIISEG